VPVATPPLDGPPPSWAVGLPAGGRPWAATLDAVAASHGIDGRLMAALVWTESNFRPDAVSHAGAIGLAQLMPGTARGLGVDPRDPVQNLSGGTRYLAMQLDAFGRIDLALAAYNAGPGRVRGAGNAVPGIVETQLYVVRVLERYEALRGL
jgi:soluble lytic murein transglycosylase-like protein